MRKCFVFCFFFLLLVYVYHTYLAQKLGLLLQICSLTLADCILKMISIAESPGGYGSYNECFEMEVRSVTSAHNSWAWIRLIHSPYHEEDKCNLVTSGNIWQMHSMGVVVPTLSIPPPASHHYQPLAVGVWLAESPDTPVHRTTTPSVPCLRSPGSLSVIKELLFIPRSLG